MMKKLADILGFIFGVSGAILVGNLYAIGFIFFIIGSLSHGVLGYLNKNYGLTFTCVTFILIDIYYYLDWSKLI